MHLLLLLLSLVMVAPTSADMIPVGGGSYLPQYTLDGKEVEVKPFLIGKYPVTNAEYLKFVRERPEWRRSKAKSLFVETGYLSHWKGDLSFDSAQANSPVVNVSWFAARAYCQWRGMRLPTQDEWEFVARASETQLDGTSEPGYQQRILSWYSRPSQNPLPPVGTVFRNVLGVNDIHGLVWEWVDDYNTVIAATGDSRNKGELDRNLYCAAGVNSATSPSDYAAFMRYAFRSSLKGSYTLQNLGFRCAADFPQGGSK